MPSIKISRADLSVLKLALEDRAAKMAGLSAWPAHEAAVLLRAKVQRQTEEKP